MSIHVPDALRRAMRHLLPGGPLSSLTAAERRLVTRLRDSRLTYLSDCKLAALVSTCRDIEARQVEGIFLEAGCALGGSTILLASVKPPGRPLRVYDVFGMIPPPTADDTADVHERYRTIVQGESAGIGGDLYYGYMDDLYDVVLANLDRFGIGAGSHAVRLIRGLVQDTLVLDVPVALAHVDVDWYDPVKTCLERVFPRLSVGGSIILDDYFDWGGCRKATDEFLNGVAGQFALDDSAGSLRVRRTAG